MYDFLKPSCDWIAKDSCANRLLHNCALEAILGPMHLTGWPQAAFGGSDYENTSNFTNISNSGVGPTKVRPAASYEYCEYHLCNNY